ncbi:MAG: hypothetical protein WCH11_04415 [Bdellovibrio sp.]
MKLEFWLREKQEFPLRSFRHLALHIEVGIRRLEDPILDPETGMVLNLRDFKPWLQRVLAEFAQGARLRPPEEFSFSSLVGCLQLEWRKSFSAHPVAIELAGIRVLADGRGFSWSPVADFEEFERGDVEISDWDQKRWFFESGNRSFRLSSFLSGQFFTLKPKNEEKN